MTFPFRITIHLLQISLKKIKNHKTSPRDRRREKSRGYKSFLKIKSSHITLKSVSKNKKNSKKRRSREYEI